MLCFRKLFEMLDRRNISQYSLTHKSKNLNHPIISKATLQKIRITSHPSPGPHANPHHSLTTATLDRLCHMLECRPEDIMEQDIEHDDGLRKIIQSIRSKEHP